MQLRETIPSSAIWLRVKYRGQTIADLLTKMIGPSSTSITHNVVTDGVQLNRFNKVFSQDLGIGDMEVDLFYKYHDCGRKTKRTRDRQLHGAICDIIAGGDLVFEYWAL